MAKVLLNQRHRGRFRWFMGLLVIFCLGCHSQHTQSMLLPVSGASAAIAWLWWMLLAICGAVFLLVMLLTAVAVWRGPRDSDSPPAVGNRFIVIYGAIIPAVILLVILIASVRTHVALQEPSTNLTIQVTGHQWWWEVVYPQENIVTANEIHIPVGEPVRLELLSADVIHSLWIPNLQGKTDLLPDKMNTMWLQADRSGVYRGQCAEFCGVQHALMGIRLIALPREEYEAWVDDRQQARDNPPTARFARGREVFLQAKCRNCHSIHELMATETRGPDLTHLGSRRTLGAGVLPNDREHLEHWILRPQLVKPGNLMPATPLEPEDLKALVDYLQSLQ